ncbi:hypothetical protein JCM11491_006572 [Sporobolomyces phaffii]
MPLAYVAIPVALVAAVAVTVLLVEVLPQLVDDHREREQQEQQRRRRREERLGRDRDEGLTSPVYARPDHEWGYTVRKRTARSSKGPPRPPDDENLVAVTALTTTEPRDAKSAFASARPSSDLDSVSKVTTATTVVDDDGSTLSSPVVVERSLTASPAFSDGWREFDLDAPRARAEGGHDDTGEWCRLSDDDDDGEQRATERTEREKH